MSHVCHCMALLGRWRLLSVVALAIAVADAPPTEFRIFAAGENATTKGTFLFDEQSAKTVMSAYKAHGIDVMIDLEHLSLEDSQESRNFDPDARGWCRLELRNGELWAVAVSWTPDGDARLRDKRQRYISPAFETDPETKRVTRVLNIAITALPATDKLQPLVAANDMRKLSAGVAFSDVQRAIDDALKELFPYNDSQPQMNPWVCDVFDTTLIYELDGKLWEVAYSFNGTAAAIGGAPVQVKRTYVAASRRKLNLGEGESPMTPEQFMALAEAVGLGPDAKVEDVLATVAGMVKKMQDAANGTAPADEAAAAAADAPAANDPAPVAASKRLSIAARKLAKLTGKVELAAALDDVEVWRTSHLRLEAESTRLSDERKTLESTERRKLVGELVKLGAETPATAWQAGADGVNDGKTPVARLANEPIADLRSRVTALSAGRGTAMRRDAPRGAQTATEEGGQSVVVNGEAVALSAREVRRCKELGADLQVYAGNKWTHERATRA